MLPKLDTLDQTGQGPLETGQVYHIVLFFLRVLFHSKICGIFGTGPVGGLGGAVLSGSGCTMHWVVVGTSRACLDIRLGIGRPLKVARAGLLDLNSLQILSKIIQNQWKSMEMLENQ